MDLLARFYDPDAGRVTFDGIDLRDITVASLRAQLGVVTQETILFHDTVRNNIAYGAPRSTPESIREAARAAHALEFIERMPNGFDTVIGERGAKISGGERQRLAIARALLRNPPILLLDEATSSLDTESERLVQDALERLMRDRTVLVIAHRLSTVQHADRIVVLDRGRIVATGTHAELLERDGVYRRLYELQFAS
jgi:ABC-type multidrug transport system fused ATPase/permease subunit